MVDRLIVNPFVVPETGETIVGTGLRGIHITPTGQGVIDRFNLQLPSKNKLLKSITSATVASLTFFENQLREMGEGSLLYGLQRDKALELNSAFEHVCDAIDITGKVPRDFMVPGPVATGLTYMSGVGRSAAMFAGLQQEGKLPALPARSAKTLMNVATGKQEAIFIWFDVDPKYDKPPSAKDALCLLVNKTNDVGMHTRDTKGKSKVAPLIWQEVARIFAGIGDIWSEQNPPSLAAMNAVIWKWLAQKQDRGLLVGGILPLDDGHSICSAGVLPDTDN